MITLNNSNYIMKILIINILNVVCKKYNCVHICIKGIANVECIVFNIVYMKI